MSDLWAFINNDDEIWQMSADEPEICWKKHHVLGCPFCDGDPAPLDENDHTSCTNIACGSTAYMHVDAWNARAANKLAMGRPIAWISKSRWDRMAAGEPWLTSIVYSEDQGHFITCVPLYGEIRVGMD